MAAVPVVKFKSVAKPAGVQRANPQPSALALSNPNAAEEAKAAEESKRKAVSVAPKAAKQPKLSKDELAAAAAQEAAAVRSQKERDRLESSKASAEALAAIVKRLLTRPLEDAGEGIPAFVVHATAAQLIQQYPGEGKRLFTAEYPVLVKSAEFYERVENLVLEDQKWMSETRCCVTSLRVACGHERVRSVSGAKPVIDSFVISVTVAPRKAKAIDKAVVKRLIKEAIDVSNAAFQCHVLVHIPDASYDDLAVFQPEALRYARSLTADVEKAVVIPLVNSLPRTARNTAPMQPFVYLFTLRTPKAVLAPGEASGTAAEKATEATAQEMADEEAEAEAALLEEAAIADASADAVDAADDDAEEDAADALAAAAEDADPFVVDEDEDGAVAVDDPCPTGPRKKEAAPKSAISRPSKRLRRALDSDDDEAAEAGRAIRALPSVLDNGTVTRSLTDDAEAAPDADGAAATAAADDDDAALAAFAEDPDAF